MSDSTEQNNEPSPATEAAETEPEETAQTAEATEPEELTSAEEEAVAPVATVAAAATTEERGKKADKKFVRGPRRPKGPAPLGRYAVIETGGKQYRVSVGDTITVERLPAEAGAEVQLDRVLLVGGETPQIGTPFVEGASVSATVAEHFRGEKIAVFTYKAKKRYRRKIGHRQELTKLAITGITS